MSYLVDSHCHLHDRDFFTADQAEEMLECAHKKGVKKIVCIGTSHEDSLVARDFASTHKDVYWTYGMHPENALEFVSAFSSVGLEYFYTSEETDYKPPVAIGEVGLDYHHEGYNREAQIRLFEEMLQLASDNDLPVSFHVREAFFDFFPILSNFPKIRGVLHSFTDSKKILKRVLDETEFFIGVNGLATYSTLPTPPLERILLETDAPFLTPNPFRGIINEPGYIFEIASWLSEKMALGIDIIEEETTKNARKLFNI